MPESKETPPTLMINLCSDDIEASIKFYTAIGFVQNKNWPYDDIYAFRFPPPNSNIALTFTERNRFNDFMRPGTKVIDSKKATEGFYTLPVQSKEEVDRIADAAFAAGATHDAFDIPGNGAEYSVYLRAFTSPDGHMWEVNKDIDGSDAWNNSYPNGRKF